MNLAQTVLGAVLAFASVGCMGAQTQEPSPRLALRQEAATVRIDGRGTVEGGSIECGPAQAEGCSASFDELWSTVVVAKPSAGWRFVGWKREAKGALAPGHDAGQTVYTATFEREAAQTADAGSDQRRVSGPTSAR